MSGDLGLAREACFYQELAESTALAGVLPKIFFAQGDLTTGEKHIIMEDLRGVQSGYFFGPYSPLNWGKDLEKATEGFPLSALQVAKLAARQAAKLHGSFWKRRPSEDCAWLRGQKWVEGGDRELWEAYQARCRSAWDRVDFGASQWDPLLRQCMETAIAQAKPENRGFEQFLAWLRAAPWSLVHGDFHPANFMLTEGPEGAERFKLVLLDWENVGIGSGPQEIAQFLISHMQPEARALVEKEILQEYYDALLACNPAVAADMSWELCWQEYVLGGAGKWAWFLPILATICDAKMTQYFHDQLLAFLVTHGITPDSMPMVRA